MAAGGGRSMEQSGIKYYLVEEGAMPPVLLRVLEAKELLETGQCATVAEATSQVGLSRSAFYKYRDAIRVFYDTSVSRIMTFHVLLRNKPGILSAVLAIFANSGANILTINQSIPVNGRAVATISAETHGVTAGVDDLLAAVQGKTGVIRIEVMAG